MTEATISIDGMSCQHCVMRVKKVLDSLKGIKKSEVEVGKVKISFDEAAIQREEIEALITKAGYKIRG